MRNVVLRRLRPIGEVLAAWAYGAKSAVLEHLPELLTATAWIAGWVFVTAGVARVVVLLAGSLAALLDLTVAAAAIHEAVWYVSAGLLLLSLGGWRLLRTMVIEGLYALTQQDPSDRRRR